MKIIYSVSAIFFPLVFSSSLLFAQLDCGNNAGFETGTSSGWVCDTGSYGHGACPSKYIGVCPTFQTIFLKTGVCINQNGMNAALTTGVDRHTIVDNTCYGSGFDPNTGAGPPIPVICPTNGGKYSFRLGDGVYHLGPPITYSQAESI